MKRLLLLPILLWVSLSLFAQERKITGTVIEKGTGEGLPGVSVLLRGTKVATITDETGKFSLQTTQTGTVELEARMIGFTTQIVSVKGNGPVSITMAEDSKALEEVVVVGMGYGSAVPKAELTGSVSTVSGRTLATAPVSSAAEALQGKAAGVQVTSMDGQPGAEINIRIRGGTSVTQSNAPLFIVDGFAVDNINDIPPTDILSIDILKDASSTAIFGARGGNGVVVVTTKRARAGKLSVNFNHNTQIRTLARQIELMNPYEFTKIQYESVVGNNGDRQRFRGNFGNPTDLSLYKRFEGNDWQNEILGGNPVNHMYNLTLNGGTQTLRFNTSLTHHDEDGVLMGSGVTRTTVNTKVGFDLSDNVKILINPRFSYRQDRGTGADKVGGGGIIDVLRYRPINGLRDFSYFPAEDLDPDDERLFAYTNPKGDIDQNYLRANGYDFTNQASIEWKIVPGLIFNSLGTQFMGYKFTDLFSGDLTGVARSNDNKPVTELQTQRRNSYGWTNTLEYKASKDKHNYRFLVGQELRSQTQFRSQNLSRYFPKEVEPERAIRNLGLGIPWRATSEITSPERYSSFFGQANYDFEKKYLLTLTYRADGSTKFAPGNRWGHFPAIGAGWVVTNEPFMADQDLFSQIKIRAAVGTAGNNRIDDDMWRYQYAVNPSGGPGWGESNETGFEYYTNTGGSVFPNPDIKWETSLTRNLAFDISMLNDRLTLTPEVYWNTTKDLLYRSNIPNTTGYAQQMQNIGQVTNRGFDLAVTAQVVKKQNAYLNTTLTFGKNKTRIDKLNGTETEIWLTSDRWKSSESDYLLKVGDQLGLIYGFEYDGIYRFDEFDMQGLNYVAKPGTVNNDALFGTQPGRPKFKNFVDEDGQTNVVNDNDRVVIGNTNPKFSGGLNLQGGWRNFDMSANFFGMYGFDVNNATRYMLSSFIDNRNNYYNILPEFNENRRWRYADEVYGDRMVSDARYTTQYHEVNADAEVFSPVDIGKRVTHSYFIEDGSFLRLQDLTLGYTLPQSALRRIKVGNLRVFASGYNLFILTKYKGYDPEVDVQGSLTPGVDYNRYPRSRSFMAGFNVTF